jgi:3-deoxy-D-manno-octulosonate 8-phosphate phosphatase (KDO 8-P phosphatase)
MEDGGWLGRAGDQLPSTILPSDWGHMTAKASRALRSRLARVKLFLCDVDGVLTDGTVFMGDTVEIKRFSILDGFGLRLLQRSGIRVGWISHRPSAATDARAADLKIDFLHQAQDNKVTAAETIMSKTGVAWREVCYVGDDIVDLGVLKRAGLAVTVPDGLREAQAIAHYVTRHRGGHGAVREVAELILKAQKKWQCLVDGYSA